VRIGFVGAGAIARSHLGILADLPGVSVAAVCDLSSAVAGETAARIPSSTVTVGMKCRPRLIPAPATFAESFTSRTSLIGPL